MKKQSLIIGVIGVLVLLQPINAQTWSSSKRLTFTSGISYFPAAAVDSNNHIYVVWYDNTLGNFEIYCRKSTNGGSSWSKRRLTWTLDVSIYPAIAVDPNNHVHVIWQDHTPGNWEIYYKKSTDGGSSWTTKRLTNNSSQSFYPGIAVNSASHIYVVWYDDASGNVEIYFKRSTDGGSSWTTKRLTWTSGDSANPAIAVDSANHLHVVWHDNTPGNFEIYYKKSTDGGSSWATKRLTWTSGPSFSSAIAVDSNNNPHVVWEDETSGNREIYLKRSTDGGVNWTTKRLTWTSGHSQVPYAAIDSQNRFHVVWYDDTTGNSEIYYKRSTNGGLNWATKRLTYNAGNSYMPTIAIDSSNRLFVVWYDDSPGNYEIYYRKGIQ